MSAQAESAHSTGCDAGRLGCCGIDSRRFRLRLRAGDFTRCPPDRDRALGGRWVHAPGCTGRGDRRCRKSIGQGVDRQRQPGNDPGCRSGNRRRERCRHCQGRRWARRTQGTDVAGRHAGWQHGDFRYQPRRRGDRWCRLEACASGHVDGSRCFMGQGLRRPGVRWLRSERWACRTDGHIYEPWFLAADGDILATRRDDLGVVSVVRLRLALEESASIS